MQVQGRRASRAQRGFTLVEIAIVLVCFALLVAMALTGQSMIERSRMKAILTDYQGLSAAYMLYQDRYRALPGDDRNAARWGVPGGNGDRQISGGYNDPPPASLSTMPVGAAGGESLAFWWHMRLTGFILGDPRGPDAASQPINAAGGVIGVQQNAFGIGRVVVCFDNLPATIAIGLDNSFDDGLPDRGNLRAARQTTAGVFPTTTPATAYVEDDVRWIVCARLDEQGMR